MKSKLFIISICLIMVLIVFSLFFVYSSIYKEPSIHLEDTDSKAQTSKNTDLPINGPDSETDSKLKQSKDHSNDSSFSKKIINRNNKNKEVVDQILKMPVENGQDILGLEKDIIKIEIIFIDGEKNQLLKNYNVVVEYSFDEFKSFAARLDTDASGKVIFETEKIGIVSINIITNEFAVYSQKIYLCYGKNLYKVKLFKGSTLEIRAINQENEVIKNLEIIPRNWDYPIKEMKMKTPLNFDSLRGTYMLSNLLGVFEVSFKAEGYQQSPIFKINISSIEKNYLEVKLQKPRKLYFTVDLDVKPREIRVSNCTSKITYNGNGEVLHEEYDLKGVAIFKDKSDNYEYLLLDGEAISLVVNVENYVSQIVKLTPHKNIYDLHFQKCFEGKVKVINSKGEPIKGATISYFVKPQFEDDRHDINNLVAFSRYSTQPLKVISGDDGWALLSNLKQKMNVSLSISHLNYNDVGIEWILDPKKENSLTITLTENFNISGIVKYGEKPVAGAKVYLADRLTDGAPFDMFCISNAQGEFFVFSDSENHSRAYLKAIHPKYGFALLSLANKEFGKPIDLLLVKEKSIMIKLEDSNGLSLPNKSMSIYNNDLSFYQKFYSNEKGEYEFYNLEHGPYRLSCNEDFFTIMGGESIEVVIPKEKFVVGLEKRDLRKVNVKLPNGEVYIGQINLTVFDGVNLGYEFKFDANGDRFLQVFNFERAMYIFEAPGYAAVKMGPYYNPSKAPKEFNIELQKGETLSIKIVEDKNESPMSFINVQISDNYGFTLSLPTNEKGEVLFSNLSGIYTVKVKENFYVMYKEEMDITQLKEMTIKLTRCGSLKCQLKTPKGNALICLKLDGQNYSLDANGNLELDNLNPGEHIISAEEINDNEEEVGGQESLLATINIESGKTVELNIDDLLKK